MERSASDVADMVLRALAGPRVVLADALPALPANAGLYAVHGSPRVWLQLELGPPPADRPLYVGKSESSLELAIWERNQSVALDALETLVLRALSPPLNIAKVSTRWSHQVREARKVMAAEARAWARARGFDC
ncbi:MAG: hypothetical protein M3O70_06280 [Actinomycetota bacterium]|nr:hypothetical protein [Actinomycetota bacterium]